MRFTCEKQDLWEGFSIASRVVVPKSSLSVLEGLYCCASSGLSFTGYNMETAITYYMDANVYEEGECIFPAKLFGDIIRRLPEGTVTVVVDKEFNVSIRGGYASFSIKAQTADDYPELPDVNDDHAVHIPGNELKKLIDGTIFSVADNQARPIHNGVKFEFAREYVNAIAVDGFRLARRTYRPEDTTGREVSFVVPATGLKEVQKLLSDDDKTVSIMLGRQHILFQIGLTTLICRLLEGDFLDWRKVVPTGCPIRLITTVSDMLSSVERVGLVVSEKNKGPVRCRFSNQELFMRTNTAAGAAEDKCSFAGDGKELEIGFNARYLADALRAVPTDEVTMELTNGMSPIVFTPVDESDSFAYMVLPVRIHT